MIKTIRTSVATLAAGLAALGVASAQSNALSSGSAPISHPEQMLPSLHAEAIIPLLDEMGIQYQGATLPDGQKVLLAKAKNGIKFQLTPTACDKGMTRCRGLSMMALFQTNAPATTVSAFNYRYAFVSTGIADGDVAYIMRYSVADYGIPRGNLAVTLINYLHMASVFDRHLYESTNVVRQDVRDTDLAANGLNMQSILADSSLATMVGLNANSHQVSFEKMTDMVGTFVKADGMAPGRLINHVDGER
ncbi:YbjN domain-containing protein [Parvularcula sp. LCG005]|uniref:YbjN domain-containing protein n=1 Tax=Parvularcula sp. LCG005 TaxID=3078805 RepID=UPI002942549F|nr:YbjN domain-containing protein [Parvularcula sp. LCG005]WOI53002.1 YbjN domain-containing protein [Parvularcula sp. LCG005]